MQIACFTGLRWSMISRMSKTAEQLFTWLFHRDHMKLCVSAKQAMQAYKCDSITIFFSQAAVRNTKKLFSFALDTKRALFTFAITECIIFREQIDASSLQNATELAECHRCANTVLDHRRIATLEWVECDSVDRGRQLDAHNCRGQAERNFPISTNVNCIWKIATNLDLRKKHTVLCLPWVPTFDMGSCNTNLRPNRNDPVDPNEIE